MLTCKIIRNLTFNMLEKHLRNEFLYVHRTKCKIFQRFYAKWIRKFCDLRNDILIFCGKSTKTSTRVNSVQLLADKFQVLLAKYANWIIKELLRIFNSWKKGYISTKKK